MFFWEDDRIQRYLENLRCGGKDMEEVWLDAEFLEMDETLKKEVDSMTVKEAWHYYSYHGMPYAIYLYVVDKKG